MSVRRSGGSASGLGARKSTTVSSTEPSNPYEGDVWVNPSAATGSGTLYRLHLRKTSDQTLTQDTWVDITFDNELEDTGGWHSGSDAEFDVTEAGVYMLYGRVEFTAIEQGYVGFYNHTQTEYILHAPFSTATAGMKAGWISGPVYLLAGDSCSFRVNATSATPEASSGDLAYETELRVYGPIGGSA